MLITFNGQSKELADSATLRTLVQQLALGERRVAIELNGEIVPRSQVDTTPMREGDRVEIVHAIGGG